MSMRLNQFKEFHHIVGIQVGEKLIMLGLSTSCCKSFGFNKEGFIVLFLPSLSSIYFPLERAFTLPL
jgi:hypothetical protein